MKWRLTAISLYFILHPSYFILSKPLLQADGNPVRAVAQSDRGRRPRGRFFRVFEARGRGTRVALRPETA